MKKICLQWFKTYRIHLLVWSIFLFYEIVVIGLISKRFGNPITYLLHYTINIFLFYFHAHNLQWSLKKNRLAIFIVPLIILFEITAYMLISYWCDVLLINLKVITHLNQLEFNYQLILTSIYRCLYFIGFSTGYYFIVKFVKERQRAAEAENQGLIKRHEMEKSLIKTQNAFLKAQINPHFLFNTLDFVYHTIEIDSTKASEAILLLSRMMRYAVSSNEENGFVLLQDELDQVENLLYLHQLKNHRACAIDLEIDTKLNGLKFIPLVLLTLMENIIKHGDLRDFRHRAYMKIGIHNCTLRIETKNLIYKKNKMEGSQIGLSNIKKRINQAYGESAVLEHFIDHENCFIVRICLPVDSLHGHELPPNTAADNDKELFRAGADLI